MLTPTWPARLPVPARGRRSRRCGRGLVTGRRPDPGSPPVRVTGRPSGRGERASRSWALLGVRFCAGTAGLRPGGGKGSPAAPWLRGRRLGARPNRVPSLCVGVGKDWGLQEAGMGILVLDAFPFVEMTFKIPGVGVSARCALRLECGFRKERACFLEGQSGWYWGNVDILLTSFFILTHLLFFLPSYQKNHFSSLEGEHL